VLPRLPSSSRSSKVRDAASPEPPSPPPTAALGQGASWRASAAGAVHPYGASHPPFSRGSGRAAAAKRHDAAGSPQLRGRQLGGWAGVRPGRGQAAATSGEAGGGSRQYALQLDGSGRSGSPAAAGPGRWAARLVALPSMGTAPRPHPAPSQHSAPMPLAQPCPASIAVASRFGAHASPARSYLRICPPRAVPVRCRPGVSWGSVWLRRCSLLCYTYVLFPPDDPLTTPRSERESSASELRP